jgi:hypothetical protein
MSTFDANDPFYSRSPPDRPSIIQGMRKAAGDAISGAAQAPVDLASRMSDKVSEGVTDIKKDIVRNYEEAVAKIKSIIDNTVEKLSGTALGAARIVQEYIWGLLWNPNTGLFIKLMEGFSLALRYLKYFVYVVLTIAFATTIALIAIALRKIYKIEEVSGKVLGGLIESNITFKTLKRPTSLKHTPLEELEEK